MRPARRLILVAIHWVLFGLAVASPVQADTRLPYRGSLRAEIEEAFLVRPVPDDSDEVVLSFEKLEHYKAFVRRKRRFLSEHVVRYETTVAGRNAADSEKKVASRDLIIALDLILERLDELTEAGDPARIFELAGGILTLEYATRAYTDPIGSIKIPIHLKNMVNDWDAPGGPARPRGAGREAGNLVDPATGRFYTTRELRELLEHGSDLSLLDPPDETVFWTTKPDIANVDIVENYLGGGDPIHADVPIRFPEPDGASVHFAKTHMTQSKPKLDVYYYDEACLAKKKKSKRKKCRLKFKLKFGMETHADPTANSLIAALGYNADLTMHLRTLRVYLGDKSYAELQADWAGYFDRQRVHTYIPLQSVLLPGDEGHGFDAGGREYIVFREAVAELKHEEIKRIGFFPFSHGIAAEHREARGLFLFNVWIANADMKDEENNKVALRKDPDGRYRTYLIQQDLGHALGLVLPEKADAFPWDLVARDPWSRMIGALRGRTELTYLDLQDNGLEDTATYFDIKWMARRIAQLTRPQIAAAVALGRWPESIGALYVEKLIHRRNQFVVAFGLGDEFAPLPVDRHYTSPDGVVVDGELVIREFEESSIDYGGHTESILSPVFHFLEESVMAGILSGVSAIDLVDPGSVSLSGNVVLSPDLLVSFVRRVHLNPDPKARDDQYLVEDSVTLGVQPGIGYIGHAEGSWLRRVTVVYPAAHRHDAIKDHHAALRLLFPATAKHARLPERYVLYREETGGAGLRIRSSDATLLGPAGADVGSKRFWSRRSIIDHRSDRPLVWLDHPRYFDSRLRVFLRAVFVEIPFFTADHGQGDIPGTLVEVDPTVSGVDDALERLIRTGDPKGIEALATGEPREFMTQFEDSRAHLNLFFYQGFTEARAARLEVGASAVSDEREEFQFERIRGTAWSFLDNGERKRLEVRGAFGALDADDRVTLHPAIEASLDIDDFNTHSHELNDYYEMLTGLAPGGDLLASGFDATEWEVGGGAHGRWTRMQVHGQLEFRSAAIRRLTEIDPGEFWERLARRLDVEPSVLERFRRKLRNPQQPRGRRVRLTTLGRRAFIPVLRAKRTLAHLEKAKRAADPEERLEHVTAAISTALYRSGSSYDPVVLATLLELIDSTTLGSAGEFSVSARITKAFDDENNLPERRDIAGRQGETRELRATRTPTLEPAGVDLYRALDWARPSPDRASP